MLPTSCLRAVTVVGVAAALVATGTAAADAAPARPSVAFHTTKHHQVVGPARSSRALSICATPASTRSWSSAHGATAVTTLIADLDARGPSGFRKHFTLRGLVSAHTDVYLRLAHGRYFLVDAAAPTIVASKVRTLTVAGRTRNAVLPSSASVIDRQPPHVARPAARCRQQRYLRVANDSGGAGDADRVAGRQSRPPMRNWLPSPRNRRFRKLMRLDVRGADVVAYLGAEHADLGQPSAAARSLRDVRPVPVRQIRSRHAVPLATCGW